MSESELLAGCLEYVQYLRNQGRVFCIRINSGMAYFGQGSKKYAIRLAPEGTADILCIYWWHPPGAPNKGETKVLWIETKDIDGKQSEAQIAFQKEVEEYGCRYEIVRNLDELVALTEG